MARTAGSRTLWQLVSTVVLDGSRVIPVLGQWDIPVDSDDEDARNSQAQGFAFYTGSAYTKDPAIFAFFDSPGLKGGFQYDLMVYLSLYRVYSAGPPGKWTTMLRMVNLSAAEVEVWFKVRRWIGLS